MNIKKEITAAMKALEIELLKAYLHARYLDMDDTTITIDSIRIIDYWIDRHNNFHCEFSNRMEGPVMRKFALLLRDYLENEDGYRGRSVGGFMSAYFEEYPDSPIGLIQGMIEIDEELGEDDSGFKEWLIGDSYTTGGYAREYKRDDLYEALR